MLKPKLKPKSKPKLKPKSKPKPKPKPMLKLKPKSMLKLKPKSKPKIREEKPVSRIFTYWKRELGPGYVKKSKSGIFHVLFSRKVFRKLLGDARKSVDQANRT